MGDSKSTQTQTSSATRDPWAAAVPGLQSVIGDASNLYSATGNGALPSALLSGQNTGIYNAMGGATTSAANSGLSQVGSLIGSGGATAAGTTATSGIAGALGGFNQQNGALSSYLTPIANGSQLGANNPEFQQELQASLNKARDTIGSQFAGAGRFGSGAMGAAEGTSLGNIAASATQQQYNQDRANQLSAIGQLSGVNTSGLSGNISGNTATNAIGQDSVSNLLGGIGSLGTLNTAQNLDANNLTTIGNEGWGNLDNLASILSSIGGLGGSSNGTATSTTQNQSSPLGMLLAGVGSVGNLFAAPATGGASAASAIGNLFKLSDRRAKEDAEPVGRLADGQTVYAYRYKGRPETHLGLMADEVAQRVPDAVATLPGTDVLMVDYRRATAPAAALLRAA